MEGLGRVGFVGLDKNNMLVLADLDDRHVKIIDDDNLVVKKSIDFSDYLSENPRFSINENLAYHVDIDSKILCALDILNGGRLFQKTDNIKKLRDVAYRKGLISLLDHRTATCFKLKKAKFDRIMYFYPKDGLDKDDFDRTGSANIYAIECFKQGGKDYVLSLMEVLPAIKGEINYTQSYRIVACVVKKVSNLESSAGNLPQGFQIFNSKEQVPDFCVDDITNLITLLYKGRIEQHKGIFGMKRKGFHRCLEFDQEIADNSSLYIKDNKVVITSDNKAYVGKIKN
jgi:hypothetical protein